MPRGKKKVQGVVNTDRSTKSQSPPPAEVQKEVDIATTKNRASKKRKNSEDDLFENSPAKNTRKQTSHDSPEKDVLDSKARKSIKRPLTQGEEDNLVEWLHENTFLYNKASADFKMKDKKARTWLEKEEQLGLNPGDISMVWYPNMRTQFSKLIKTGTKSGSGLPDRTDRQNWLLERFAFIRPYLVQLRQQRGSTFAEKRKDFATSDTTEGDVQDDGSDVSVQLQSEASQPAPKSARLLVSSLNEELSTLKDTMKGPQDKVASTGQFLVHMMRDMTESTRQGFILSVTKMAIEAVQKDKADTGMQQQQQHVFAMPTRRPPPSSTAGSGSQPQPIIYYDQDFQLATNIGATAQPAHITPRLSSYRELQPISI